MKLYIESLQHRAEEDQKLYSNIVSTFNHLISSLLKEPGGIGESSYKSLIELGYLISPNDTMSVQKFARELEGRFTIPR